MVRFGSYYGGFWIPSVDATAGSAVCVGAGLDISFDLELVRLGYRVYTADPTPAAVEYVTSMAPDLTFLPLGVSDTTGDVEFVQDSRQSALWTIGRGRDKTTPTSLFPVVTVKDLLASINDPVVAVLKLDIEGMEHDVIRSMIRDNVQPAVFCVDFDDKRLRKILQSTSRLRAYGYELYQIETYNFTFVRLDQAG
jgi:FkbM family methyltransferase